MHKWLKVDLYSPPLLWVHNVYEHKLKKQTRGTEIDECIVVQLLYCVVILYFHFQAAVLMFLMILGAQR